MNEDRVIGTARNLGGQAQEGLGRMTGDTKSQVEGVINQAAGAAQESLRAGKRGRRRCRPSGSPKRHGCRRHRPPDHREAPLHHRFRGAVRRLAHRPHGTPRLSTAATPWSAGSKRIHISQRWRTTMGKGVLLWLIGIPIPVILLLWLFGFLHS